MSSQKRSKNPAYLQNTQVSVNFDYSYIHKSKEIHVFKGEVLDLLQKTNEHWWKCLRVGQPKSFYVPALYVSVIDDGDGDGEGDPGSSGGGSTDDENLNPNNYCDSHKERINSSLQSQLLQQQQNEIDDTQSLNSIPPNHIIVEGHPSSPNDERLKYSVSTSSSSPRRCINNESASTSSLRYDKVNKGISTGSLRNINNGSYWSKSLEELSSQIVFPGQGQQSTIFFNNPGFKADQDNDGDGGSTQSGAKDSKNIERSTPDSLESTTTNCTNEGGNVNEITEEPELTEEEPTTNNNNCNSNRTHKCDVDVEHTSFSSDRSSQEDILVPVDENLIRILQNNWSEYRCLNSDRIFYYNSLTKCTSWKPPRISKVESNNNVFTVPKGWIQNVDEVNGTVSFVSQTTGSKWFTSTDPTGKIYFYEENSSKSSWFLPAEEIAEHQTGSSKGGGSSSQFPLHRHRNDGMSSSCESSEVDDVKSFKRHSTGERDHVDRSFKSQSLLVSNYNSSMLRDNGSKSNSLPRDYSIWDAGKLRSFHDSFLNRTKLLENNKKVRKNWTTSWAVLTHSHLTFFKDQKALTATPIRSELEVDLHNSSVEWAKDKSSRKHVFLITSPTLELLCQSNNQAEAEVWFANINCRIQELQTKGEEITIRLKGSSLPKSSGDYMEVYVGGDGTSKRRSTTKIKITGTTAGAGEEQKYQAYRSQLKKFFNRRPPRESLVKKGIYKDERVFGCTLEKLTALEGTPVPIFVDKCIQVIESKEENMKTDGIYRASGNLSQVQRIRLQVDQDNMSVLEQEDDVHVLAGSLKLFFREMREPVLPTNLFDRFLRACQYQRDDKVKEFQSLIKALPSPNYITLKTLLEHLLRVSTYSEHNRMQIPNLAIVFGPTLMWNSIDSNTMAIDLMQQNYVVEILLTEFKNLFH